MNSTKLIALLTAATLALASAATAESTTPAKSQAQVTFQEPEKFTDFRQSESYTESDSAYLQDLLTRAIARSAAQSLPAGLRLSINFTDINLAGEVNPTYHPSRLGEREYKAIYKPHLKFTYSLTDASGAEIASGAETLTDPYYDQRVLPFSDDYTRIEADLLRDFILSLAKKAAKPSA